jgi:hypothetical protein
MSNVGPRIVILAVVVLPLVILGFISGPIAFDLVFRHRAPERYLIPAGFTGWVQITFDQKDAPALPVENGHRLIKLDAHGVTATSSGPLQGHGRDDFFYYSANGRTKLSNSGVCKGGMIWELETMNDTKTSAPITRFFVGTEDQYRHELDPTGKKELPVCE